MNTLYVYIYTNTYKYKYKYIYIWYPPCAYLFLVRQVKFGFLDFPANPKIQTSLQHLLQNIGFSDLHEIVPVGRYNILICEATVV